MALSRKILVAASFSLLALGAAGGAAAQTAPPAPAPAPSPVLTAAERARYVGAYELVMPDGQVGTLTIYESGEDLMAQPPGNDPPSKLIRQSADVFTPEAAPGATVTFTVEDNRATKFLYVSMSSGMRIEGVRKP